jgi:hypothetical protein
VLRVRHQSLRTEQVCVQLVDPQVHLFSSNVTRATWVIMRYGSLCYSERQEEAPGEERGFDRS